MPNPPFSGVGNDLDNAAADYSPAAGGNYVTTIPSNFAKMRTEVLGLHSRLLNVEAVGANNSNMLMRVAGVNEFFQVRRTGPAVFAQYPAGPASRHRTGASAVEGVFTGARLAPLGGGTFNYIPSLWSGWMMAQDVFTDAGQAVPGSPGRGMRVTFNGSVAYANDTGTPFLAAGGGDVPALYQVLTRQLPIEAFQNRSLHVRMRYLHSGALPVQNTYRLYIAFVDASGFRQTSYGPILGQTSTTEGVALFSTADDAVLFPDGVIPVDAAAVEIGLALEANSGAFTNDPWDIFELSSTIGAARGGFEPSPLALDMVQAYAYYAQPLGPEVRGEQFINAAVAAVNPTENPLMMAARTAGGTLPAAGEVSYIFDRPWALVMPWKTPVAAVLPATRSAEIVAAVADAGASGGYVLSTADTTVGLSMTNPNNPAVVPGVNMEGFVTTYGRQLTLLTTVVAFEYHAVEPYLRWEGELFCTLAPINA